MAEGLANIILVIGVMSDLTVHYFSAPLMILLDSTIAHR